ncbi:5-formyltetrahydrofolate cyclo-ligase [Sphingobium sp. CR28]
MDIPANGHGGPVTFLHPMTDDLALAARAALRRTIRAQRRAFVEALPASVRTIAFRALPSPVRRRIPENATVALYAPTAFEAPTRHIAIQLAEAGHPLCLPAFDDQDAPMNFARWLPDDPMVPGPHRVHQPEHASDHLIPDALIIPMLGFDARLQRLGQGGGHYDRALAALPGALRIGLAWSCQQIDSVPTEAWDMPMDMIVTEQRFFEPEMN